MSVVERGIEEDYWIRGFLDYWRSSRPASAHHQSTNPTIHQSSALHRPPLDVLLPVRMTNIQVWRGEPYPLGATLTPEGVNFSIFSQHATGVDLCLFDDP